MRDVKQNLPVSNPAHAKATRAITANKTKNISYPLVYMIKDVE